MQEYHQAWKIKLFEFLDLSYTDLIITKLFESEKDNNSSGLN